MAKFFDEVLSVLKQDGRFFADDGTFMRNAAYEAAMKMDADLLRLLLNNEETCKRFFTDVDGVKVFDKVGFGWVINNRQFLPDSYTRFKNKIGLVDEHGDMIASTNKVELVFPYKDCVLVGGQTKEDQKRQEIFFNETLAPDEVDRLLYPKVLTRAKRYTRDSIEEGITFREDDNLIIKGNNLLAISSLLKRYEGKVKCILIDPPYYFEANKPSDTFLYNSNFKLSTWLIFMKNRLQIAHRLLANDGVLYISISDEGAHYLKVLTDEIYQANNFIADVTWESRKSMSSDGLISENNNHILVYAKEKNSIEKNNFRLSLDVERFNRDDNDGRGAYRCEPFDAPGIRKNLSYAIVNPNTGAEMYPPPGRHWRTEEANYKKLLEEGRIFFGVQGLGGPQLKAYYSEVKAAGKGQAVSSIWHDVQQSILWQETDTNKNATQHQIDLFGKVVFPNPKPEDLVRRCVELSTEVGDIVLDFFMGSATTQATALKMHRQFLGVDQMAHIIDNVAIPRLMMVLSGEQGGISRSVNWQGGGSFVYCELAQLNQTFVDDIEVAEDEDTLSAIYAQMIKSGFISCKVDPKDIDAAAKEYKDLSLADKKQFLIDLLDMNLLYVNYCDMDDKEFAISDADKAFTKSFYGED